MPKRSRQQPPIDVTLARLSFNSERTLVNMRFADNGYLATFFIDGWDYEGSRHDWCPGVFRREAQSLPGFRLIESGHRSLLREVECPEAIIEE